jgi:hypothetical protein
MFERWNETKQYCMPLELYIYMSVIECGQFVYNCISRENEPTEELNLAARDLRPLPTRGENRNEKS